MVTLQLKDICGYLPYGLKVINYCGDLDEATYLIDNMSISGFAQNNKPILYPIDYLYKPMIHNSKEIIPIVELAKIAQGAETTSHFKLVNDTVIDFTIAYHFKNGVFWFQSLQKDKQVYILPHQYKFFDLLSQLHIDFRGLIPQGLAVSVDELEVNPYK